MTMTPNLYRPSIHRKKDGLLLVTCTGQGRFLTWLERLKLWLGLTDAERLEREFCRTPITNAEDVLGEARKLSPDLSDWIDGQLRLGCSPENIIGVINAGTRLVKAEQEAAVNAEATKCRLCGEPMPEGEEMFVYHGFSGPCPKPPLPTGEAGETALELEYQRDIMADALRQIADATGTYVSIAIFAVNKAKETLAVSERKP